MGKFFGFLFILCLVAPTKAQDLRQEISQLQDQKIKLLHEQKRLLEESTKLEKKLNELALLHKDKAQHLAQHQEEISKKLPLLARLGRANPLRILADPSAGQDTLRGIILVRVFTASLKRQMQKIQAEVNDIEALSKDLQGKTESHIELLKKVEFQQAQLSTLKTQKIEDWKNNELHRLADEDDINALLGESREALSKKEGSAATATKAKGLPFRRLEHPVLGKIIEDASFKKKFSSHSQGVVFETKKEAEVRAPAQGKIVFKGPFRNQGDILILDHGKKVQTIFMGMHKIDAYVGQKVYAGEKLGTMAGYGAKPPKLYLELRQKGKAIDPQPYFAN